MIKCKVSMHIGKKYSIKHNLRNYKGWNKDGHIDPSRTLMNEVLVNHNLRDWFYGIFVDAILQYNEKQDGKHNDRKINIASYFAEQQKRIQEAIIQLGDHGTYTALVQQLGQERADEFFKNSLVQAFEKWQKDNPSLRIFHASIHMDEVENGTPHLHIDFLPVAESSRGLTTKVSLDGALKPLGFVRDKKDKYGNTPYKQWLASRRENLEAFFQNVADSILGKDQIEVLPSERSCKSHQETWEHREEQKGLAAVKSFLTGEGKAKVKAAEEIIANAEAVAKAIIADAERKMKVADKRTGEAVRKEKVANSRESQTIAGAEILSRKNEAFKERVQLLKEATANLIIAAEVEVQRRLSPATFTMRRHDEDERYQQRRKSAFAVELEKAQEQGMAEQERTQVIFEKAKYKTTSKGEIDLW